MPRGSADDEKKKKHFPQRFMDRIWARWFYEILVWMKESFYIIALHHKNVILIMDM